MKRLLLILFLMPLLLSGQQYHFGNDSVMLYRQGDSIYAQSKDSSFLLTATLQMGSQHLVSDTTVVCDSANAYRKISGIFLDGVNANFILDSLGKITFVGINGTNAIGIGVSDLASDKVSSITYGLYKNGALVPIAETTIDFTNPGKAKTISITRGIPNMVYGDFYEVYVRSDTDNTTISVYTLMLSFICDR